MKIKHLFLFALILIAASCGDQEQIAPDEYGAFTKIDHKLSGLQPITRSTPNGIACNMAWKWNEGFNLHTATSSSTATTQYKFWPDRTDFFGPGGYNPITSSTLPTVLNTVLTIMIKNTGKSNLKYSLNGGATWTQLNRNAAPVYFTISVPDSSPFCTPMTEPQMYVYQTIMWKSINCYPDTNNWGAMVGIYSCTNGSVPWFAPGGGMSVGWTWSPPSYPCSYTL